MPVKLRSNMMFDTELAALNRDVVDVDHGALTDAMHALVRDGSIVNNFFSGHMPTANAEGPNRTGRG